MSKSNKNTRPLPAIFQGKDTYGISTNANRDRLPAIDASAKPDLKGVLVGQRGLAARVAIAGLQCATEVEDIGRLVIGAIVDASGILKSAARLSEPVDDIEWSKKLTTWSRNAVKQLMNQEGSETPQLEDPKGVFPKWVEDLEISAEHLAQAMAADEMEVAAYAGALALAIGKQPTSENMRAFNENRRRAVSQFIPTSELKIFIDESVYLNEPTLGKVHRTFNSIIKDRAIIMAEIVKNEKSLTSGPARLFYVFFQLLSGTGLNQLLLLLKFGVKYPEFYDLLPDLTTEYYAVERALLRLHDVEEHLRPYLKAIFGSAYVPVDRRDINSLLGVAVFVLKQSDPTLENYHGGVLSAEHRKIAINALNIIPEEITKPDEALPEA